MKKKDAAKEAAGVEEGIGPGVAFVVLLVAALVAYGNSFSTPWQFDDLGSIIKKEVYETSFANFRLILLRLRAVVDITFFINRAVNGLSVGGYHAVNFAIHLGSGLALLGILRRTPGGAPIALPVALLFIVHPLQTESVTYIVQRAQSLMGLFELVSFYCIARSQTAPRRLAWHAGAVVTFFLGMLTKPHLVLEPLIVLLYERAFFAASVKEAIKRSPLLYAALFSTWAAAALYITTRLMKAGWSDIGEGGRTPVTYAAAQAFVIPYYVWLTAFPWTLCIDYGWKSVPIWQSVLGGLVLLGLVAATAVAWRRSKPLGFLGLWFFLNIFPGSGVIPRVDLIVEHRMYVPLASLLVLAVVAGRHLLPRHAWVPALAVATIVLAGRTHVRNRDYATPKALWAQTVSVAPRNPRGLHNLATALKEEGDLDGAFAYFTKAIEVDPTYAQAWNDRGDLRTRLNRFADAIGDYTQVIGHKRLGAMAVYNRGNAHKALGRRQEAIADYSLALEKRAAAKQPRMIEAIFNRGCVYQEAGDQEKAIADFTESMAIRPDLAAAYTNRGNSYLKLGKPAEARADFEKAIALAPGRADGYFERALALASEKRFDEAWADVKKARQMGCVPNPQALEWLKQASGRSE